jgi:hypothetical protein
MRLKTLTLAALAWASLGLASALAEKVLKELPAVRPVPAEKATTTSSDPAEPPLQVEMSADGYYSTGQAGARKVTVASSARGTTLTLPTSGSYSGSARLTFKNTAAPMRFTTRRTGLPNYDFSSLRLSSDSLSLEVGQVGTTATTRYFDAKGRPQDSATGASYTVTAKRGDNGQVNVELRRAAGATLGKNLTIQWASAMLKYSRNRLIDG